jgi:type II secretory pathway pseudopilin PulG
VRTSGPKTAPSSANSISRFSVASGLFAIDRRVSAKGRRSFTLIELLVAAVLTVVLAGLVLAAVAAVLRQWNRSTGRLGAAVQARLALDQITQDLQCAILRADGKVWLAAAVLPDTSLSGRWQPAAVAAQAKPGNGHPRILDLGAPRIEDARFGVAGVWLRFFTTKPDTNASAADLSAPVAVGYQLIRQNVTSSAASEQRYLLFRAEVRRTRTSGGAPGTFEAGYNLDPAASPATLYLAPNATAGDPGNLLRPPLGSVLADDVIDFGVRLYVREGGGLRLIFPARPAGQGAAPAAGEPTTLAPPSAETEHLAGALPSAPGDHYRHALPEVADVMIRVLTDEGARLIAAFEAGRLQPPAGVAPADYWWTLAEAHSQVFARRIVIPGRAI